MAVAASGLLRAEEFAKSHGIPKAYGSYAELAVDPTVDVVYVGVVNAKHHEVGLLFLRAGKNVLCEKPLAMNLKEVQELISAARENKVFLMEAFWTRFFPAIRQMRTLLAQDTVGDIIAVNAEFGANIDYSRQKHVKETGCSSLLDIGCYCVQLASMLFKGEKPQLIQATGILNEQGVDEMMSIVLKFPSKGLATCLCTGVTQLPSRALIIGAKGYIELPFTMWCPTVLVVNGQETQYPLPSTSHPLNYINSVGLRYEAEEVRQCLLKGMKECPLMPLAESELIASILDEARRQVGVVFPQDS